MFTSQVGEIEAARAALRAGFAVSDADAVLRRFDTVLLNADVLRLARTIEPARVRMLDAIHLASALSLHIDDLTFVAYDTRLLEAARAAGLATASPGA